MIISHCFHFLRCSSSFFRMEETSDSWSRGCDLERPTAFSLYSGKKEYARITSGGWSSRYKLRGCATR